MISRNRHLPTHRRRQRGGYVYFFILSTCLFMTAIAMAALSAARINGRALQDANDASKAEALAESAVEFALQAIANDPNWRADYPNALPVGPLALGDGTISWTITDDVDGNLTNNTYDSVRIYGVGRVRNATKIYSVQCAPTAALDCLQTALTVGNTAFFSNSTLTTTSPAIVAANGGISADTVNFPNAITLQSTSPNGIALSNCTGVSPTVSTRTRQLPDPNHVFDYYVNHGTAISISNLPTSNGIALMQLAVLGPASNPYGASTNAQGIYVLDCQGQTLQISNMRIVGTLVILNPGAGSGTTSANYIAPAITGFPSLLVPGDFTLDSSLPTLADDSNTGVNYNPPGTPYLGFEDTTFTTTYPSRLDGIVYVSGNLTANNSPIISGVLIAGGSFTQAGGSLNLTTSASSSLNPPPGFTSPAVVPVAGSWKWEKVQ